MPRYIAKSSISHGEGHGDQKKSWKISNGQSFDPAEMAMTQATVDRLLADRKIALYEGGNAPMARPIAVPTPDYLNRIHAKAAAKAAASIAATTPSE